MFQICCYLDFLFKKIKFKYDFFTMFRNLKKISFLYFKITKSTYIIKSIIIRDILSDKKTCNEEKLRKV